MKIDDYNTRIKSELLNKLDEYKIEVEELLQIFKRKDRIEAECAEANVVKLEKESQDQKIIDQFLKNLKDEIKSFKEKEQGGIAKVFEQFYTIKLDIDSEISKIFNTNL